MASITVLIFHRPASSGEPDLVRVLSDVRSELIERHSRMFRRAGAKDIRIIDEWHEGMSFGEVLAELVLGARRSDRVERRRSSVAQHVRCEPPGLHCRAASDGRLDRTIAFHRTSSRSVGRGLCALCRHFPATSRRPRRLEEQAEDTVAELLVAAPPRSRSGHTPGHRSRSPRENGTQVVAQGGLDKRVCDFSRLAEIRELAANPHRELLVFGRSSSGTLRWLERNVRARVRFLAEERGLRASSPLAIGLRLSNAATRAARNARSAVGRAWPGRSDGDRVVAG